ncbi:MAG: hypothetical protein P1U89_01970 [Verrucomicrobiales bacterium]|nr:hypothetical protein [Verrucomicrobiales bacterium]
MPEETEKAEPESTGTARDPLEIKSVATGVMLLVAVCSVFWVIAKLGPIGADWLNVQTQKLTGIQAVSPSPSSETTPEPAPEPAAEPKPEPVIPVAPPAAPPVTPPNPTPPPKLSHTESARQQIQEALGGPEKVVVRHIAISEDELSMVAAINFLESDNPKKLVEIYFTKDEFRRYKSTEDSPVDEEITVWEP